VIFDIISYHALRMQDIEQLYEKKMIPGEFLSQDTAIPRVRLR
jgi:hypothetical protein